MAPRPSIALLRTSRHVLLLVGAWGLSVWQAGLTRSSLPGQWVVGVLAVLALGAAVALGRHRQRQSTRQWAAGTWHFMSGWRARRPGEVLSVVVWGLLIGGVVGWDLTSFVCQSHDLPTLSYFIGHLTRYPAGRGLLFGVWLVVGASLVAGGRARVPR